MLFEVLTHPMGERVGPGEDVFTAARRLAAEELAKRPAAVARVHAKSLVKLLLDHSLGDAVRAFGVTYQPSGVFSRLVRSRAPSNTTSTTATPSTRTPGSTAYMLATLRASSAAPEAIITASATCVTTNPLSSRPHTQAVTRRTLRAGPSRRRCATGAPLSGILRR